MESPARSTSTDSTSEQQDSTERTQVRIYRDEDQHEEVEHGGKLYKDLITYFILKEVKLNVNLQTSDVIVETQEDKNTSSHQRNERHLALRIKAELTDSNGNLQFLCVSCAKKSAQILHIRNSSFVPKNLQEGVGDIIIRLSVACSGIPSSSTRPLTISFTVTQKEQEEEIFSVLNFDSGELEKAIWKGKSEIFTFYHHRRVKRKGVVSTRNEKKSRSTEIVDLQHQYKTLQTDPLQLLPKSLVESLSPKTLELLHHASDIFSADFGNQWFDRVMLHGGVLCLDSVIKYLQNSIEPKVFQRLSDFLISHADSNITMTDVYVRDKQFFYKHKYFLYSKFADIVVSRFGEEAVLIRDDLLTHIYAFLLNEPAHLYSITNCTCPECEYSHLAWIIQYARRNGAKRQELVDDLNNMKISTRLQKGWHSSLNGILNKKDAHYLGVFYIANSSVGKFSRKWFPPSKAVNQIVTVEKFTKENIATNPEFAASIKKVFSAKRIEENFRFMVKLKEFLCSPPIVS